MKKPSAVTSTTENTFDDVTRFAGEFEISASPSFGPWFGGPFTLPEEGTPPARGIWNPFQRSRWEHRRGE